MSIHMKVIEIPAYSASPNGQEKEFLVRTELDRATPSWHDESCCAQDSIPRAASLIPKRLV
jgi:hypothetical protein